MINIKTDSRKVTKDDTFVAIKGYTVDGHDYIESAIKNGANKIICEHGNYSVETEIVEDTKKYLNNYLVDNYSREFKDLKFIGVTGTNGKTTTCYLTYQLLNKLGIKTCYIGTIGCYYDNIKIEVNNTTPDILELYNLIIDAKKHDCKIVVMEVSSHSLAEGRINGINFDVCAFTNLTQDHLDFHKTMDNYCKTKMKLIDYLKDDGKFIVNIDDKYANNFITDKSLTLGTKNSNYHITDYELNNTSTKISFNVNNDNYHIKTNLIGKFNIYNYLTSLALVHNLGYKIEDILNITSMIEAPAGRAELIKYNNSVIVIDYAHTPDAVSKIIDTFKEVTKGRIITLVGCGGERDPKKRPIMGSIASNNSDYVIFTNDNPRMEDEKIIMEDILKGISKHNYLVIYDRKDAIHKGLSLLEENDTLLLLGKGHEDYQIIGRTKIHLSDKEEVYNYINK